MIQRREKHHQGLDQFSDELVRKAERKIRAQHNGHHDVLFGLSMFGLVGWSVAVPVLLGISLGWWIDRQWPGPVSWTITFLFLGLFLGCFNAWRWILRESGNQRKRK